MHSIGQNIPLIYPHFETAIVQSLQFLNLEHSKDVRRASFLTISLPLYGTPFGNSTGKIYFIATRPIFFFLLVDLRYTGKLAL